MDGGCAPFDEAIDPVETVLASTWYLQDTMRLASQSRQTGNESDERGPVPPVERNIEEDGIARRVA